ncbi:MAG: DUF3426 domain-containing protein [Bacillota bacterium]
MFTTCSHCHTRFRVTAKQLKAAGGQVRCGKCDQVFDAFAALEAGKSPAPAPADVPEEMPLRAEPDAVAPELDAPLEAVAEPPAAEALDLQPEPVNPEVPPIEDLFAELPDEAEQKSLPPPLSPETEPLPFVEQTTEPKFPEAQESMFVAAVGVHAAHAELLLPPPPPAPPRPAVTAAWWSGIALLALLLLAQLVNADRDALGENLVIGSSLRAFYAALGSPLPPAQSPSDWDVSGVNVTTDPDQPGALSITGSLANQAAFAQPWPYLRVVLTDRYGQTLRARDFKSDEYLPGTQPNVPLAAGQASRFRLDIVDPGADAVGFTLLPCLDAPGGRICSTSEHD